MSPEYLSPEHLEEKIERLLKQAREIRAHLQDGATPYVTAQNSRRNSDVDLTQAGESSNVREEMNARIRQEMVAVWSKLDKEYSRLEASISPIMERRKKLRGRLNNVDKEPAKPTYAAPDVAHGVAGGLGGALMGLMLVAGFGAPIVLIFSAVAGMEAATFLVLGIVVVFGVFGAIGLTRSKAEERTRNTITASTRHQLNETAQQLAGEVAHREKLIAELQQQVAELRRMMTRQTFTPRMRELLWLRDDKTCYLCGRPIEHWMGKVMHIDHVVPWSRGGTDDPENLRATHVACNLQKGSRKIQREFEGHDT